MTRARDIANLVDANGDIVAGALDNVPAADVVNDTTPQLGGNLESNGNDVVFADNDKAIFGAGSDLQIYHDGSNSIIAEASVGSLKIQGSDLYLTDDDGTNMLYAANNGGVTLYQGGGAKLATTSTGVSITGDLSVSGSGVGKVLQVVQAVKSDYFTTTSTSFVDIPSLTASITPSSTSSKIMVDVHIGGYATSVAVNLYFKLLRGSTDIGLGDSGSGVQTTFSATTNANRGHPASIRYLDSPATTSATTYKVQTALGISGTLDINRRSGNYSTISTITLTEIGA